MIVNQTFSSVFFDSVKSYNQRNPSAISSLPEQDSVTLTSDFDLYINASGCQAMQLSYTGLLPASSISVVTSQDASLQRIGANIADGVCGGKYIMISGDLPLNTCTNYQGANFYKIAHAQTYSPSNAVLEQGFSFTQAVSTDRNIIEIYRTIAPFYKISFTGVVGATMSLSLLMVGDR
jgi:hypothetical protein